MNTSQTILGAVHSLETFGLVDGPGVRYVIFLQGCHMRCRYCHNPETWSTHSSELISAEDMFAKAYRYHNYWKDNGGITVSGGEPLLQIKFVTKLFKLAKEKGIHTCIDTAGQPFDLHQADFMKDFDELLKVTDLFLLDIKEIDSEKHRFLTGQPNENILSMGEYLSDHRIPMWVRHVLVPGLTDDTESLYRTREWIDSLKTVKKVEILPYHTLGLSKWKALGIPYSLENVRTPSEEEVAKATAILCSDR